MSYRKLIIGEKEYTYKIGKSNVEIRDKDNKRLATVKSWDLKGITEEEFRYSRRAVSDFAQDKENGSRLVSKEEEENGSVRPRDIEKYIKENLM